MTGFPFDLGMMSSASVLRLGARADVKTFEFVIDTIYTTTTNLFFPSNSREGSLGEDHRARDLRAFVLPTQEFDEGECEGEGGAGPAARHQISRDHHRFVGVFESYRTELKGKGDETGDRCSDR